MIKSRGVNVQSDLNRNSHIQHVVNKMFKAIGIINRVKYKFEEKSLLMLHDIFVYPYVRCCNIVLGNGAIVHSNIILVL